MGECFLFKQNRRGKMRISRKKLESFQAITGGRVSSLIPPRNYGGFIWETSELRVWLPEAANQGLKEVCAIHETSITTYLTEYLATYLFGYHELLLMRANESGLYEVQARELNVALDSMFCLSFDCEPQPELNLGKNIFALKILIPTKIKEGLQFQAEKSHITLGELCRALICSHLFGRQYWGGQLKKSMLKGEPAAQEWENIY